MLNIIESLLRQKTPGVIEPQGSKQAIEPAPTFLDLEDIKRSYPRVLSETLSIVKESNLAKTEPSKTCLWYCLAQAKILRPLLRDPTLLLVSGLCEKDSGPDYNPHREIDMIGGDLIVEVIRQTGVPADVFIEERGWVRPTGVSEQIIIVDPLDQTSSIENGVRDQATGIVFADKDGNFLAGGISSLVDNEMVLIEENNVRLLSFDGDHNQLLAIPLPFRVERDITRARIATLTRRMKERMLETPLFKKRFFPDLPTFGGYGVLCMLRGQIDVLIDPFVGQPWYEACLWGNIAEKFGLIVTGQRGKKIDFPSILKSALLGKEMERVKIAISTHQALQNQLLDGLKSKIKEGEIV